MGRKLKKKYKKIPYEKISYIIPFESPRKSVPIEFIEKPHLYILLSKAKAILAEKCRYRGDTIRDVATLFSTPHNRALIAHVFGVSDLVIQSVVLIGLNHYVHAYIKRKSEYKSLQYN